MLDLKDQTRFNLAKTVLQGLERDIQMNILGAEDGEEPQPIELSFSGLKSM